MVQKKAELARRKSLSEYNKTVGNEYAAKEDEYKSIVEWKDKININTHINNVYMCLYVCVYI